VHNTLANIKGKDNVGRVRESPEESEGGVEYDKDRHDQAGDKGREELEIGGPKQEGERHGEGWRCKIALSAHAHSPVHNDMPVCKMCKSCGFLFFSFLSCSVFDVEYVFYNVGGLRDMLKTTPMTMFLVSIAVFIRSTLSSLDRCGPLLVKSVFSMFGVESSIKMEV
jgi:hypothetical protein